MGTTRNSDGDWNGKQWSPCLSGAMEVMIKEGAGALKLGPCCILRHLPHSDILAGPYRMAVALWIN